MDAMSSAMGIEERFCLRATQQRLPLGGTLELLPLCNMNCDMCYVRLSREEQQRKGRILSADEWLALAEELRAAGTLFILLTGGEPLLHPEFEKIYTALINMGMIVTINTNGTLINEELVELFTRKIPRRINVTIYGKDADTYEQLCHYPNGYDRAVEGIRMLRSRGIAVKIHGTITPLNRQDSQALADLANALDVPLQVDSYLFPSGRERDRGFLMESRLGPEEAAREKFAMNRRTMSEAEFDAYCRSFPAKLGVPAEPRSCSVDCRAGRSSFLINWQGEMRPCVMMSEPTVNVFEMGFAEGWKQLVSQVDQIRMAPKCASCEYYDACLICAACAKGETGSYDGVPEYMCRYTEEYVRLMREESAKKRSN